VAVNSATYDLYLYRVKINQHVIISRSKVILKVTVQTQRH